MISFRTFVENVELERKRKELKDQQGSSIQQFNTNIKKKRKLDMIKRLRDKLKKQGIDDTETTNYFDNEERTTRDEA